MRAALALLAAVMLGTAHVPGARAGEVPPSALSLSWGIHPIFLESPGLLYVFPQRAAAPESSRALGLPLPGSALWATTDAELYNLEERNLGGLWRGRSVGLFALAQPSYLAGGEFVHVGGFEPGTEIYPPPYQSQSDLLQVGVGVGLGAARAGLALRATRHRSDSGRASEWSDGTRLEGEQNELDYLEVAFGLGFDLRGVVVDADFEWQDESYEEAYGESVSGVASAFVLRGDARGASGFTVRIDAPAGDRLRILGAGRYHWGNREWAGTRYEPTGNQQVTFGERPKTWDAHLGLVFTTAHVDRLVLAGSYVHYDEPLAGVNRLDVLRRRREASRGALTVAAEKTVWRTLALRAGVSGEYRKTDGSSEFGGERRTQSDERLGDAFHWGLSYRWKGLRFESSLRSPPTLDNPFEHLDLYWIF